MRHAFLVFLSFALSYSQSTNSVLSGTITDSSSAVVPGAKVTVRNTKTGVQNKTETNNSGVYIFGSLPPGPYSLTVESTGFTKAQVNDLTLEVGGRATRDIAMAIGSVTETMEVKAESISLNVATTSVGGVLSGERITSLPLVDRDALDLIYTQAGIVGSNLGGSRAGAVNVTLDGINVQDNRYNSGVSSVFQNSTDAIAEIRIVTSPADAEFGRGSGQIQMVSKSGSNSLHGALFEQTRNRELNANNFFNNLRGRDAQGNLVNPRDFLIQNQFGGNISGPIRKNKTFFFFLTEANRIRSHETVSSNTYTATARQGLYRFYAGARNANAGAANPSVDGNGNPIRPDVRMASLFGRDPQRPTADPTGTMKRMLDLMPLPNDFRSGDGLNTAGYRWQRSAPDDLLKFQFRIDHNISESHRANFSYNNEREDSVNTFMPQPFPTSPTDARSVRGALYSFGLTSTFRPNLINEFHAGAQRAKFRSQAPWEVSGTSLLPTMKGQPYIPVFPANVAGPIDTSNDPQGRLSPVYQASDAMTWLKGTHTFKGGFEARFVSSNGFNSFGVMPRATIGAGAVAVAGINTITGIGNNAAQAQTLLNVLAGSFSQIDQSFNSPGGTNPQFLAGEPKQRTWKSHEFSGYFKDDYRLRPGLLLNIGIRYEYYGVPFDANGKTATLVGGSQSIFGISGTTLGDIFSPGKTAGSLTNVELGKSLFHADKNNFAPAVGISWNLPKRLSFGKTAVFRTGYGMGYERHSLRLVDIVSGDEPGLNTSASYRSASIITPLTGILPVPVGGKPLRTTNARTETVSTFDSGLRQPYVQNWNATLEFEVAKGSTLDVRYVGSKGTRLVRGASINEVNIIENGVLDAFKVLQTGGCPALMNRIIPNCTGVQNNSTIRDFLANNNVGDFATYLNTTTFQTGSVGGLLSRAGLPNNFIVANPQFLHAHLIGNFSNSIYHSMQVEYLYHLNSGLTLQSNLTWSKLLGDDEGDSQDQVSNYRTLRNLRLDRRILDSHRAYVIRNSGTYELPIGPGKKFLGGKNSLASKLIGGWSTGFILNIFSGIPMDLTNFTTSLNDAAAGNTPVALTAISKSSGQVKRTGNGVIYFPGWTQVDDPSRLALSAANQRVSAMFAIADASGKTILVNPLPGQLGTLAPRFLTGPRGLRFDLNLRKKFLIREGVWFELRADAQNASNTPYFDNPVTDINDPDFGRITSGSGNRVIVIGARFQF